MVGAIIEEAYEQRASDIHIDPLPESVRVRFRADGLLSDAHALPLHVHAEVIARIKILAGLRTDEHNAPQDGRFRYTFADGNWIDVRVSVMPTYHGENAVLRLLVSAKEQYSLASLGFSQMERERIEKSLEHRGGMILATGPTGSGKTTTLYTLIQMLNRPEISIVTVEDPIEYAIEGVRQIQVNHRTGLTFASGLRSMLRQDPDVIMVGEIRDTETASIAVNTALTGHLVLTTLHTTNAATTLPRLLDMKIEPYLVASTIQLAIGQRLVRRICIECKEEVSLPDAVQERLPALSGTWYRGKGCDVCSHSGYKGRVSINEVLVMTERVRDAVARRASASEIQKIALAEGMHGMMADGIAKANSGDTTIEEVLRATHE